MTEKFNIKFMKFDKFNISQFHQLKTNFLLNKNFSTYHEFFERAFVEPCIKSGIYTKLKFHNISTFKNIDNDFLIGNNLNVFNRCRFSREFFDLYEKNGDKFFFKNKLYRSTKYYEDLCVKFGRFNTNNPFKKYLIENRNKKNIIKRLKEYILMYNTMKKNNTLIPNMKKENNKTDIYYPSDFPWSIKYSDYIRHRDGSHRRSIAFYLKWNELPTLEFEFDLIKQNFLEKYDNLLYEYFSIYKKIIEDRIK